MDWMLLPLRRYAQFNGRARPKEYWMFVLFLIIGFALLNAAETMLGIGTGEYWLRRGPWWAASGYYTRGGPLTGLFALAMCIPYLAVAIRRLHDTDRSGWWLLLASCLSSAA